MEPTAAEYMALTVTRGNGIALEFNDSFQYGRLWEGLFLGINCEGIPLSNSFNLSKITIIFIDYAVERDLYLL